MSKYDRYWANRVGAYAAATVSPSNPEPAAGAALELATANLTPAQHDALLNDTVALRDEEEEARAWHQKLLGGVGGAIGSAMSWAGDQQSKVNDLTTRVQRSLFGDKWADVSEESLGTVGEFAGNAIGLYDEHVWQPWSRRLATPLNALNIAAENRDGFFDFQLLEGETWSEAWKRSQNTTLGQAFAESRPAFGGPERRAELHATGFDEHGNPRNQAFAEIRKSDVEYNLISGTLDFAKGWFADPLVIGGKGARAARALTKGDLDRLPARQQQTMRHIMAAPEGELSKIADSLSPHEIVKHRAVQLARQKFALRDQVREGKISKAQLASQQSFKESPNGAAAAHIFAEAANTRKVDPNTGRFLDEFDDDIFDLATAAMMGHPDAKHALIARNREIGDTITALETGGIAGLDEAIRLGEVKFTELAGDPNLSDFAKREVIFGPDDIAVQVQKASEPHLLDSYHGYEDWLTAALDSGASLTYAPRMGASAGTRIAEVTSNVFRGSGLTSNTQRVTSVPLAVWRKRPGVVDLHRAESAFENAERYLTQAAALGTKGKQGQGVMEVVAQAKGAPSWGDLRDKVLSEVASATTDAQRRRLMGEIEDIAIATVAAKHGMTSTEAAQIADQVRGLRANLVNQAQQRVRQAHAESLQRYSRGDRPKNNVFEYTRPDGHRETLVLPVDVTELQNYFVGTDLGVLNTVLRQHGDSLKASLWRGQDRTVGAASQGLSMFNHVWKPAVLFRLGYVPRTVGEDTLRVIAATGNFGHILHTAPYVGQAAENVGHRIANRVRRVRDRIDLRESRAGGPNAIPESLGGIDAIDAARLGKINKELSNASTWEKSTLHRQANGGKPRRAPGYVSQMNKAVENWQGPALAVDPATGKALTRGSYTQPFEGSKQILSGQVTSKQLRNFAEQHAELLSNPRNTLLVQRIDDGFEVSVARRHASAKRAADEWSASGEHGIGLPVHIGQDPRELEALRVRGEKPVKLGDEEFTGAFDPNFGDIYRAANSSRRHNENLSRAYEFNLGKLRASALEKRTVNQGDKEFYDAWAEVINDKFRHSPIIRRMLEGDSDEKIVSWLNRTPEGRKVKKRIPFQSHNPERWVAELRTELGTYLPTDALKVEAMAGPVLPSRLAKFKPGNDPMPASIDNVSVGLSLGDSSLAQQIAALRDKAFNALATVPTDQLVRNPFFERNYRYNLSRQLETKADDFVLTPEVKAVMERQAREYALKQTRKYLFSLADETEFIHAFRHLSPFGGAWQESMVRWGRVLTERPESFARMYVRGWEGMGNLWGVEQIEHPLSGEPTIQTTVPKPIKHALTTVLPGVSPEDLEGFDVINIPKQSLNVTLQGTPWWAPGSGPTLQLPAKFLIENDPELADDNAFSSMLWKWLFPIGVPKDVLAGVSPAWVNQARRYFAEDDDPVFANLSLLVYRNDHQRWKDEGRVGPEPTFERSFEKAKGIQAFYTMSRLTSPFSFQFQPQSQFWIDKAREYREDYGHTEGLQRFTDELGEDAYTWWTSLSKTNVNVPPTSEGHRQYKRYQEAVEAHPDIANLIVGLDAEQGEFNYSVYEQQRRTSVGPGDSSKMREHRSVDEALADAERSQGWAEWRQWRTAVDAELAARGLTSLNQREAADLAAANQVFKSDQFAKLPGWQQDFETFDVGKNYRIVGAMRDLLASGGAPDRPDWDGIAEFVHLHDSFAAELDARAVAGGNRSIEANDNADLAAAWSIVIGQLTERNLQFADVWARYFDGRQLLTMGSGT